MRPTTITDDRIAQIEILAEEGPITTRMVSDELGIGMTSASDYIKRMVKLHILEKGRPKWINQNWNDTYQTAATKAQQSSMFSAVKRDALVAALFGDYTPEEGAAWVF